MLTLGLPIDPSEGFERAIQPKGLVFPGDIIISSTETAKKEAEKAYVTSTDLILWSDGSKLETETIGAGIVWKNGHEWQQKLCPLGRTKEVFDAELYGIRDALNIAIKGGNPLRRGTLLEYPYSRVIVFSDSQAALRRAQGDYLGPGQAIAIDIIAKAQELTQKRVKVILK